MRYTIAAFYRFVALPAPGALRDELLRSFPEGELLGTILIAPEGVNGTVAGSSETIDRLLGYLEAKAGLQRNLVKFSYAEEAPFGRLKIKRKDEIIAFRKAAVDPAKPGTYVPPRDWNALIADPEVLVLDTRNDYEVADGTFRNAVDPGIQNFSQFADFVREKLDPNQHRKIAMFCTGGIRCEKASAFMLQQGFAEVFHLEGGILKYLEEVPEQQSEWLGECFVFDRRRKVGVGDYR